MPVPFHSLQSNLLERASPIMLPGTMSVCFFLGGLITYLTMECFAELVTSESVPRHPSFVGYAEKKLPDATHVCFEPGPDAWEQLEQAGPFDALGGYSLGSQLLLKNPARASELSEKVGLLAPIFAFADEAGLGGRISRTQVRYLSRWLLREREAALTDFYLRAGLDVAASLSSGISSATLDWGLSRLQTGKVLPPAPSHWKLYCGTADALLDGERLAHLDTTVNLVAGATHHPEMLLRAWARDIGK